MRHNRVLGLAIASALAIGANLSYAGKLEISYASQPCGGGIKTGPAVLASEIFFSGDPTVFEKIPCGGADDLDNFGANGPTLAPTSYDDVYFYATYTFDTGTFDTTPFLAEFSLDNGAKFGRTISLGSGANLDFVAHPSGSHAGVTINSGGNAGDSSVTFYIMPASDNAFRVNQDTLVLRFSMNGLGALKDAGEIKMTASVYPTPTNTTSFDGTAGSATVATSARSSNINMKSSSGIVEIDVAQANTQFVGGGSGDAYIDSTKVRLGNLAITDNTLNPLDKEGKLWTFASNTTATGTLTITDGVFSASLNEPGRVFLDCGSVADEYDSDDLLATVSADGKTAVWNLTNANLQKIYDSNSGKGCNIVLEADGTSTLIQLTKPAQATLKIDYGGGVSDPLGPVDLIYIKRNGVACSIYNVPTPKAIDRANIRITNTSGSNATVYATLRDAKGTKLFDNIVLVADLAPNATFYTNSEDLDAKKSSDYVYDPPNQRMVLEINSNVKSLEIFGLVRNRGGGPLTNMSVAATGNGCD